MKQRTLVFASACAVASYAAWSAPGHAQKAAAGPFYSSPSRAALSNNTPLAFGMDEAAVANALGVPLNYISGRPGNEILLALRSFGGSGLFERRDRLYLQFRRGRLTGWKGDWGHNWMWR
jgi:hypothetical protein